MPRAGSVSKRAESVFVDEELFTVMAVLVTNELRVQNSNLLSEVAIL